MRVLPLTLICGALLVARGASAEQCVEPTTPSKRAALATKCGDMERTSDKYDKIKGWFATYDVCDCHPLYKVAEARDAEAIGDRSHLETAQKILASISPASSFRDDSSKAAQCRGDDVSNVSPVMQ